MSQGIAASPRSLTYHVMNRGLMAKAKVPPMLKIE